MDDGVNLNDQLHRWNELIESALEFLAERSSRSKINRKKDFEALFDFVGIRFEN